MAEAIQSLSAIGSKLHVTFSNTFPAGFDVEMFADDNDPFQMAEQQIADYAVAFNGTLLTWDKAVVLPFNISVVPGSDEDKNLTIAYNANRRTKDHVPAGDIVTIVGTLPNGETVDLKNGKMLVGKAIKDAASTGRFNSRTFNFVFADAQ